MAPKPGLANPRERLLFQKDFPQWGGHLLQYLNAVVYPGLSLHKWKTFQMVTQMHASVWAHDPYLFEPV